MDHRRLYLDAHQPVEWRHPLNRGLVCWLGAWPNPGWSGGATARDLCRRSHGTLANGAAWGGLTRPGGLGRPLLLDATDDRVTLAAGVLDASSPFTLSWWERVTATTNTYPSRFRLAVAGGSAEFLVLRASDATYNSITWGQVGTPVNVRSTAAPSLASGVGRWLHWCLTCTSNPNSDTTTDYALYVDGVSYAITDGASFGLSGNTLNYVGYDGADNGADCAMDDLRVYRRALSAAEVRQLYGQARLGHPDTLRWLTRRSWSPAGRGAAVETYTGTAAVDGPTITLSATGTFTPPTYTGTSAVDGPTITASGSATFSPGTKTATAAVDGPGITLSGTGAFTAPVYTGTAAVDGPVITLSAAGSFVAPVYTGSSAVDGPTITLSAAGTFTAPVYTGVGAVDGPTITLSAAGTFVAPVYTGTSAVGGPAITLSGSGVVTNPTYAATGSFDGPTITLSATGFTGVVFSGNSAVDGPVITLAGSGTFAVPTYTGTAALDGPTVTLAAAGTFTAPVYTGTSALDGPTVTLSASGTFIAPVFTGTAALDGPVVTLAASAAHVRPTYTGTAALDGPAVTLSGVGRFLVYTATASLDGPTITFAVLGATFTGGTNTALYEHSPADIVRYCLISLEHGSLPTDDLPWPIFVDSEPQSPDNCITIYDTEGRSHGRCMVTNERQEHQGILVRVRAANPYDGYGKARRIALALDQEIYDRMVIIPIVNTSEEVWYNLHNVTRLANVRTLTDKAKLAQRSLFTMDALVSVRAITNRDEEE